MILEIHKYKRTIFITLHVAIHPHNFALCALFGVGLSLDPEGKLKGFFFALVGRHYVESRVGYSVVLM